MKFGEEEKNERPLNMSCPCAAPSDRHARVVRDEKRHGIPLSEFKWFLRVQSLQNWSVAECGALSDGPAYATSSKNEVAAIAILSASQLPHTLRLR